VATFFSLSTTSFDHGNGVEQALCFALLASGARIRITDDGRLSPASQFKAQKMQGTCSHTPPASGAAMRVNLWQEIEAFGGHDPSTRKHIYQS
jgi:hypothetical protein